MIATAVTTRAKGNRGVLSATFNVSGDPTIKIPPLVFTSTNYTNLPSKIEQGDAGGCFKYVWEMGAEPSQGEACKGISTFSLYLTQGVIHYLNQFHG
jgi:hypothetical protein